ncbi:MAG: glycosyltransferase [Caldilineaceae bacterium]
MSRKSICILALSPIARDGRVLRQIQYLSPHYDLTVVGYGPPHPHWADHPYVRWLQLPEPTPVAAIKAELRRGKLTSLYRRLPLELSRLAYRSSLYMGRILPAAYDAGYSLRWRMIDQIKQLIAMRHDAYHANDWNTLSLAFKMAKIHGARVVIDLHEYAPLEFESQPDWWLYEPMLRQVLQTYGPQADAAITVAPPIAERYRQEFGFEPIVVLNAPEYMPVPAREIDAQNLRIIHHGAASKLRRPEVMIEAIAHCDQRYSLHFMFVPSPYVEELKQLAAQRAPGRVSFHAPVAPEAIVPRIAEFDIGFTLLPPQSFNDQVALPNKFFECIGAALALCAGPSSSMAAIIQTYGCGVVAPSFAPEEIAATLNQTSTEEWCAMRTQARTAALDLNAAHEMGKVVQLYAQLLNGN